MTRNLSVAALICFALLLTGGNTRSALVVCKEAPKFASVSALSGKYGEPQRYVLGEEGGMWIYLGHDGACFITAGYYGPINNAQWRPALRFFLN